jgi:hypothetical protein
VCDCEGCLLCAPHSLMVKLYKHALTPLLPPDLKLKADGTLAPTTPVSTLTVLNREEPRQYPVVTREYPDDTKP